MQPIKEIQFRRTGAPERLRISSRPAEGVAEDQVGIRVAACGVGFGDIMLRMGLQPDAPALPCVPGYEVSGVVEQTGAGVSDLAVGDHVMAVTRYGGYSEHVTLPRHQVARLPESISLIDGAAIPVNYLTAWTMLEWLGNLRSGQSVLIHAVAGGVGQAALQLCKRRNVTVFGTASASKHERLRSAGVDHCFDYRNPGGMLPAIKRLTGGRGVDLALDCIGGRSYRQSFRALAPMGRLMLFGANRMVSGGRRKLWPVLRTLFGSPIFGSLGLLTASRGVIGVDLNQLWHEKLLLSEGLKAIAAGIDEGSLVPTVDRRFALENAAEAHRYLHERRNFGKVVLVTRAGRSFRGDSLNDAADSDDCGTTHPATVPAPRTL